MSSFPSALKAIGINKHGDFDVIAELNVPFPQQKEDEVLIKVDYAGVNFIDTYQRSGLFPSPKFPTILGQEAAGTIVKLPSSQKTLADEEYELRGFKEGDRVAALLLGGFSQYASISWKGVAKLPALVSTKDAAAVILQGLTALTMSKESYEITKGDVVLVYAAAGGVGLLLTQIALHRGATVIGTVSTKEKAKVVKHLGAQHTIVTSGQNTVDEVLRITNGQGVDAVFDGIGKDTFEDNFKVVARKGTIVSFGNSSGQAPAFTPLKLADKNVKFVRPRVSNYLVTPEENRVFSRELFSLLERGVVKPVIHQEYPFTAQGIQQAQRDITSRGTIGKLVVKVD